MLDIMILGLQKQKIEEKDRDRDMNFGDEARFKTYQNKISRPRNCSRLKNQNFEVEARPR